MSMTFFKRLFVICTFILLPFTHSVAWSAALTLKDIRVGGKKLTTRIVLDLTKTTQYKVFTLKNPYRVVIDTSEFKTKLEPQITMKARNAVKSIRQGVFRPGVSRTVIELRYPIQIKKVQMLKGSKPRFVIDIKKSSSKKHVQQKTVQSKGWDTLQSISTKKQKARIAEQSKYVKKDGKPLIVIDAGHGGPDPGSIGVGGAYEKHITLAISKALQAELLRTGKYTVHLTRSKDYYIPLRTRYRIAEKKKADFFISIHADKHQKRSTRGMSVYTLSDKSSDREASRLARKENLFDELVGQQAKDEDDIVNILIDISQSGTMNAAALFAKSLVKNAKRAKIRLLRRPHRFAGFAVLKSPHVPSVLIESGYMSNKYDIRNLTSKKWRKQFAIAIRKTLDIYFKNHPIPK